MIVECNVIKTDDGAITGESSFLSRGTRYLVMGMAIVHGKAALVHLVSDDGTLVYSRADQFTVVNAGIPTEWQSRVDGSGAVDMGYPLMLQAGFLEIFFDGDPEAKEACRELVARVHDEAGMPRPDLWTY